MCNLKQISTKNQIVETEHMFPTSSKENENRENFSESEFFFFIKTLFKNTYWIIVQLNSLPLVIAYLILLKAYFPPKGKTN